MHPKELWTSTSAQNALNQAIPAIVSATNNLTAAIYASSDSTVTAAQAALNTALYNTTDNVITTASTKLATNTAASSTAAVALNSLGVAGSTSMAGIDLSTAANATTAITVINNAIAKVSSERSNLGLLKIVYQVTLKV